MSVASTHVDEAKSENLNRFNNIIGSLPLRTSLTISSLCLLDNISTQLLRFLIFNSNSPQIIALYSDSQSNISSGETEIFQTLLKLFKQVRLIYNTRTPLLNVHDVAPGLWFPNSPPPLLLRGHEAYIITAIRKANLLTFILTAIGCFNYGFELLQSTFLDIFCPNTLFTGTASTDQNGKFLKSQAILYLDLKTQAFIAGLKEFKSDTNGIPKEKQEEILKLVFPDNLAEQLILRRTGSSNLGTNGTMTPSERDFIERCERRKDNLLQFDQFDSLIESYDFNHFIKEILDYCNRNMGLIIWGKKGRGKSPLYSFDDNEFDNQIIYASGAMAPNDSSNLNISGTALNNLQSREGTFDSINDASQDFSNNSQVLAAAIAASSSNRTNANNMTQSIVHAAVAASAQNGVRKLKPKRTWSKTEEDTLIEGLKEVGPSWSKILDLYGPGGKINENLKSRTQVQLKDKARNWKLQYLKSGRELPDYLAKVTGNLDKAYKSKKKAIAAASAASNASGISTGEAISSQVGSQSESVPPTQIESNENQETDQNGLFDNNANETTGFDPTLGDSI
ncbi:hypothetical protein KAFR_0H02660 [Kazachstania africana CBS 2517]|uniref:Uncharacterized protein n=1 Tax=Kazachstania africana (strain ATCC 22294 / BCRC 22015 / CBS 2517 / CECT 1963 / NBRC 1671 / NRRL Y-8276) TaxID=1071382 RepID=H2AZB9_KAZAF|nr:hypothetical protein KAFR_0H02660 [Kazachstania africana CBS 2517]CCF59675.1 hypothetical protein KAFR_0H02660 [Kazachstania africana CBS 2517]